jgi:hypothetical protein
MLPIGCVTLAGVIVVVTWPIAGRVSTINSAVRRLVTVIGLIFNKLEIRDE